jgi:hypothetical protein
MDKKFKRFTHDQTLATFLVLFHRNTVDLFKQIDLTICHIQGLKLATVAEFLGGLAPADTALAITEMVEETFEL